jgi:MFS family permease
MVPIGRLIVMRETRPEHVIRAIAYLTWPALAAPILAPVVGGLITTYASWRWIFLVNLPLGAIALLCTGLIDSQSPRRRPMDWAGFALCAVSLVALTVAVSFLAQRDVVLLPALTLLAAALLVGVAGAHHLLRSPHPLLRLTVLRVRTFRTTVSGGSVYRIAVNGVPFLVPLLLQERFGWTPARAGLYLSALFLGGTFAKPATGVLFRWLGFRRVLILAVAGSGATIGACALLHPGVPAAVIALLLAATGACRSIVMSVFQALSMADLDPDEVGDANTLFSTLLQLFTGLGVSAGALALRLGTAMVPADAYAIAFGLLAVLMSVPLWEALTLSPGAGARLLGRD